MDEWRINLRQVERASALANSLLPVCSTHLIDEAVRAIRAGKTLTFGPVELDREGIRGRSWSGRWQARWKELVLVRFLPGRIGFFRRQTVIPYRVIRWDKVPHPFVLIALVKECAVRTWTGKSGF